MQSIIVVKPIRNSYCVLGLAVDNFFENFFCHRLVDGWNGEGGCTFLLEFLGIGFGVKLSTLWVVRFLINRIVI